MERTGEGRPGRVPLQTAPNHVREAGGGSRGGVTSREGAHPQQSSGGVNLLQHGQENESGTERHSAGFALKRPVSQADVPRVGTSLPPLL